MLRGPPVGNRSVFFAAKPVMPLIDSLGSLQIVFAVLGVVLGAFVQGAAGFAYGMIAIPVLLWAGLSLPQSVGLVCTTVIVQTAAGVWRFRRHVVWRDLPGVAAGRYLGLPVGLLIMAALDGAGRGVMKQVVGAVLLGIITLTVAFRPEPRERVAAKWSVPVGFGSGLLSGTTGMGGPPVVLWMIAHDWSTQRGRAWLWSLFLAMLPVQVALMAWGFGRPVVEAILGGLVLTPLVLLSSHVGGTVGSGWSRPAARRVVLGLLVVLAAVSIVGPWLTSG